MSPDPERTYATTTFITKRINDHALCDKEAEAAWRRSPMWLVIRVALQTTLHDLNMDEHLAYKAFMLYMLSSVLGFALDYKAARPPSVCHERKARTPCSEVVQCGSPTKRLLCDGFRRLHMNERASRGARKTVESNPTRDH
jgi:hypothetical protein